MAEEDQTAEDDGRTFQALLRGDIPSLKIAICTGSTRATREEPYTAVWEMNREQFVHIAEHLQATDRFKDCSLERIAQICDETGIENRFFRLNSVVAEWIDNNDPVAELDYLIL